MVALVISYVTTQPIDDMEFDLNAFIKDAVNTTVANLLRMIALGGAFLRFCDHRRRGHSPFKVVAKPQRSAEQARAAANWQQ